MSELSGFAKTLPGFRIANNPLAPDGLKKIIAEKEAERLGIDTDKWNQPEGLPFDKHEILFLIALFKLSKTPEGLKVINNLGGKFIDGLFSAQKAMCATAAGNDITAWGSPVIQSAIFERFGIVPPGFNSQFHLGLSMLAGADFIEDIASSITGMFSFSRTAAPDKIQSITYTEAPRTDYQQEIETGEVK